MASLIWIISITICLLLLPYFLYVWLYGFTLLKSLFNKYWRNTKTVIADFSRLTPEQRMEIDTNKIVHKPQPNTIVEPSNTAWLDSPRPEEASQIRQEVARKEGERPKPTWEDVKPDEIPPLAKLP